MCRGGHRKMQNGSNKFEIDRFAIKNKVGCSKFDLVVNIVMMKKSCVISKF